MVGSHPATKVERYNDVSRDCIQRKSRRLPVALAWKIHEKVSLRNWHSCPSSEANYRYKAHLRSLQRECNKGDVVPDEDLDDDDLAYSYEGDNNPDDDDAAAAAAAAFVRDLGDPPETPR